MHLALGGCLKSPPIAFGITSDTGGHIAYVLGAAMAQGARDDVACVSIVTRCFEDPQLASAHASAQEALTEKVTIDRLRTSNLRYLEKAELTAELDNLTVAFLAHLRRLPRLPDVIHAHFADAAMLASEAQEALGIPFAYTPHSLGLDKLKAGVLDDVSTLRLSAERKALQSASVVIASSQDECSNQIAAYGSALRSGKPSLILPGVPAHVMAPAGAIEQSLATWFAAPSKPIVLAIARPVRKKNLIGILRAYAGCSDLRDLANLVILAGQRDGPTGEEERAVLAEMEDFVAQHDLKDRVALPVQHDAGDVAALYALAARSGVFVNPALHEPFGLTLIEAAAAGVPVVATTNGGPREIVANLGHGLLVDPLDTGAIAAACLAILGDGAVHRGFAAAGLSNSARYSWSTYAAESVAHYRAAHVPGMVVCDIDATLTGCRAGADAFRRWREGTDLRFVVATGRSFDGAVDILNEWGMPEPDALILDVGTRIMLRANSGRWEAWRPYSDALSAAWHLDAIEATLAKAGVRPQARSTRGPHKTSYFGTAADARGIRKRLAEAHLPARVIFSHGNLIDVVPETAGKAAAIEAYGASIGLKLDQCIAAGDSGNDLDMIERCGRAIIVSNATAELAGVKARPGLFRASRPHASGVMEGLAAFGLAPSMAA